MHFLSNKEIVFGTNDKREFLNLMRMDLTTRQINPLDNSAWDLDASEISGDGKTFAYTINREGFSELYVVPVLERFRSKMV
ncbi:MAG: hypothetical protein WKF71_01720 [Pyrinomonadaceae bacterium]